MAKSKAALVGACRYHPGRAALGICTRCRSAICKTCCTRVRGINHCHACLEALARPAVDVVATGRGSVWATALAVIVSSWLALGLLLLWAEGLLAP